MPALNSIVKTVRPIKSFRPGRFFLVRPKANVNVTNKFTKVPTTVTKVVDDIASMKVLVDSRYL